MDRELSIAQITGLLPDIDAAVLDTLPDETLNEFVRAFAQAGLIEGTQAPPADGTTTESMGLAGAKQFAERFNDVELLKVIRFSERHGKDLAKFRSKNSIVTTFVKARAAARKSGRDMKAEELIGKGA